MSLLCILGSFLMVNVQNENIFAHTHARTHVMLFSEKCADPHEKSYYACGNSSRPSLFAKNPLLGETELL